MKKNMLKVGLVTVVLLVGFSVTGVSANGGNNGIPSQIQDLITIVNNLEKHVADLLPFKDTVKQYESKVNFFLR